MNISAKNKLNIIVWNKTVFGLYCTGFLNVTYASLFDIIIQGSLKLNPLFEGDLCAEKFYNLNIP